jgi:hypothetical protein
MSQRISAYSVLVWFNPKEARIEHSIPEIFLILHEIARPLNFTLQLLKVWFKFAIKEPHFSLSTPPY